MEATLTEHEAPETDGQAGQEPEAIAPEATPAEDGQADAPALFDADAPRHAGITLQAGGELYEVGVKFRPADDTTLTAFARKIAEAHKPRPGALTGEAAHLTALSWLFDQLSEDGENIVEEGEPLPDDWRGIFSPTEKAAAIERAVFGLSLLSPPPAPKKKRPVYERLACPVILGVESVEGQDVTLSHTLRKLDAKQYADAAALLREVDGGRDIYGHIPAFAALYDALHVGHAGYRGRVPVQHKYAVALWHVVRQGSVITKN